MNEKKYVGWKEAMKELRVSNSTLLNYRQQGCPCIEVPHGKVTYHLYNLADMRRWIEAERVAYAARRKK